jgi:hypothetical protein
MIPAGVRPRLLRQGDSTVKAHRVALFSGIENMLGSTGPLSPVVSAAPRSADLKSRHACKPRSPRWVYYYYYYY